MDTTIKMPREHVELRRVHPDAVFPTRGTPESAGLDLTSIENVELAPGGRALVATGWLISLPPDWEGQVRPRSGLSLKTGVTVLNAPGTIDPDYRGPLGVILVNTSPIYRTISKGDRIAQLVLAPVHHVPMVEVDVFTDPDTIRGENGYGSTGR